MRRAISRIVNLIIALLVLWAWLSMTFRLGRHGSLSAGGLQSLKYFTVLSNLLQGAASLLCLAGRRPCRLKYAATVAVALTFFVVLLFLGPVYGFESIYTGANFWFHLVVPVLAMLDFLFLDREGTFTLRDSLFAMIPMMAYGLFYVGNLIANGVKGNDWYGFAGGGPKSAALTFGAILLGNWMIALLLRLPRRKRKARDRNDEQRPPSRGRREERIMDKNYRAELVGVLGDPVDGNPTGVMEEAAFERAGLNWRYITVRVLPEDLDAAMAGVRAFHMRGVNLTMPHKVAVLRHMDALSEAARIIGAVNTVVVREDGTLFGENTDGKGFVQSLADAGIPLGGAHICLLGAGGAARSIGVECALAGAASVAVVNRNRQRGEALAELIRGQTRAQARFIPWEGTARVPGGTDILINATSVGLHPRGDQCPDIDFETVRPGMAVCDVIFNPVDTPFLTRAAARGARTVDGLGMLVNQGAINYSLWTGQAAPREVMRAKLASEFGLL